MDINPFAGLIRQVQAYVPPVARKKEMPRVAPYERILAVRRMERGESPSVIASELGITAGAVMGWRRQARREAEAAKSSVQETKL